MYRSSTVREFLATRDVSVGGEIVRYLGGGDSEGDGGNNNTSSSSGSVAGDGIRGEDEVDDVDEGEVWHSSHKC